jgi:hypothetical protein
MPLNHWISPARFGFSGRQADCIQSEKFPYPVPGITQPQRPVQFIALAVRRENAVIGINLAYQLSTNKILQEHTFGNFNIPNGGLSGYPHFIR